MIKRVWPLAAFLAIGACSGPAIVSDNSTDTPTSGGICNGTTIVCADDANSFTYDAEKDEIHVNNLPFDLDGTYAKIDGLTIGGQQVYKNVKGARNYYALYVQGANTETAASVVATDDYINYGPSGTMFRGTGKVDLPTDAEATYSGSYQGIRIYEAGGQHGFSTGDIEMVVDFEDMDDVGAISTTISNRVAYDENGVAIGNLPGLVTTDTHHENGIIQETAIQEGYGSSATGATGTLSGIFSNGGDQIAGVLVLEGKDALSSANVRETGAFVIDQVSLIRP
ncbi:hypothetical protein ACTTAI_04720 [Rhodobacter capsulatus]|uniref:hypothetical protein n=1 Tax=Rhodobacter capsulatus TaxID=1061 RepID=UPI00402908F6